MKNILVDLIDTQECYKGSGVYIRTVFLALLKCVEDKMEYSDVHFVCVYDFNKVCLYSDISIEVLSANPRVTVADISVSSFPEICIKYSVSTIFLGFGQQIYNYNFIGIKCRTICVLHDIFNLEFKNTKLDEYLRLFEFDKKSIRQAIRCVYYSLKRIYNNYAGDHNPYDAHIHYFKTNPNYIIVTVSEFSFFSLQNYLPLDKDKIRILWSPNKSSSLLDHIDNVDLKRIVDSHMKYLLVVNADRALKNPHKAIDAFNKYVCDNPDTDLFLVTIGFNESLGKHHLVLPYVSDSDIEYAYLNCYALLYPSFFEGFGYPPVEVMKYGKPVLSSNVTSMPEVLGDAPIWFSPFYSTDIYKAINTLMNSDYNGLCRKSVEQYIRIKKKQDSDLSELVNLILS